MKWLLPILILGLGASGCSSIATFAGFREPDRFSCGEHRIPRVYSGVANDIRFIKEGAEGSFAAIVDMPFSFVLDTVALPYTIYAQIRYGDLCDGVVASAAEQMTQR